MKIKNFFHDIKSIPRVLKKRQDAFKKANDEPIKPSHINQVANELHPGKIDLEVTKIFDSSVDSKTFRFKALDNNLPLFMAGQYLSLELNIDGVLTHRPYSISSAPCRVKGEEPYVEITVRMPKKDAYTANYMFEKVKVGDRFKGVVGLGEFHYDAIRDSKNIVAIAGGSGITPFVSMAEEIVYGKLDVSLTIIYGSVSEETIVLKDKLNQLSEDDRIRVIHVLSGDNPHYQGEKGFIDRKIIEKYSCEDCSFFVCGPQVMYDFVRQELANMNVPLRRIRFEVFGQHKSIEQERGFNKENIGKVFNITVVQGIVKTVIQGKATESLAVAIERAKLVIDTACRSGACGLCHIRLISGEVFINPNNDGRRRADKECGYVHACATYPCSDIVIKIPIK